MANDSSHYDPMEFLRSVWGQMPFPVPGFVTPTLDVGELDKRIADLKAVEGWLRMNLGMLHTSIQALEVQRATLATMQSMAASAAGAAAGSESSANPMQAFGNPALWPWSMMQSPASPADASDPVPPGKESG
ncbi:PhaM family polyhydroxyalkanoate granule multifunctional regulatory protein [Methyloversatilis thermotolerans]|uniref:PhaM family polyhydroxyalkanoate granule multifunctional regulatory protein n=1 Tax=Methyloversatilis thermotolerans TaxID=1346290 RepID=UPI0003795A6E|nr:PhaM family polyhydroxyalkanoate granule multifunctional regulatory protein [Methyloversatilis thermotolerans]